MRSNRSGRASSPGRCSPARRTGPSLPFLQLANSTGPNMGLPLGRRDCKPLPCNLHAPLLHAFPDEQHRILGMQHYAARSIRQLTSRTRGRAEHVTRIERGLRARGLGGCCVPLSRHREAQGVGHKSPAQECRARHLARHCPGARRAQPPRRACCRAWIFVFRDEATGESVPRRA